MSMLVRLCGVILSLIVLYCIGIKMYITFPPADFTAVMSLWRLLSLSCVVFIFIPSFYHISSSSPNALLISVHFNASHSDLYQIYSLVGWVVKWSGDTGEFYGYRWQLSPHGLQSSCLLWNMKHSYSGFAFHFNLLPLPEWMYMLGFFNLSSINYFYIILGIIDVIILLSCSPYHFGSKK